MTGSDPEPDRGDTATQPQKFRWWALLLGAAIAGLGVSGLLDDSGLIEHPWWVVIATALVAAALMVVIRTARAFWRPSTALR